MAKNNDLDLDLGLGGLDMGGDLGLGGLEDKKRKASDNPYDLGEDFSYEEESKKEMSEALKAFKAQGDRESQKKSDNTSTEYWCAIYFKDQAQRDEFLRKINAYDLMIGQYIHGEDLADRIGVDIEKKKLEAPKPFRKARDIKEFDILPESTHKHFKK